MGAQSTPLGQAIGGGLQQMQQQANPQMNQGMVFPEFKYSPKSGLQVNFGNDLISQIMSGLQQQQRGTMQSAPVMTPGQNQLAQNPNILQQRLPISSPMGYPQA